MIKEENSRRGFFKKAAAVGAVAAVGVTAKTFIFAPSDSTGGESAKYADADLAQEKAIAQKQFVLMTDGEKEQMLNEMLGNYHKELA